MSGKYTGGCAVHCGMFSTLGDITEYAGGYHEYTGGVQDSGGYHDECGVMSTPGDVQYTGVPIQIQLFSQ